MFSFIIAQREGPYLNRGLKHTLSEFGHQHFHDFLKNLRNIWEFLDVYFMTIYYNKDEKKAVSNKRKEAYHEKGTWGQTSD